MITELTDFNIRHANTFRMDITCLNWIEYTSADDLPIIFSNMCTKDFKCIGAGSNLLFLSDYPATLLHSRILDATSRIDENGDLIIRAGAGIEMDALAEQTCQNCLWGLENLSGIPGEVGASAVQNVGAYGVEAKDVIESVECYDTIERKFKTLSNQDCGFDYRMSIFKKPENKNRYVVTYVNYRLSAKAKPVLEYGNLKKLFAEKTSLTPMQIREAIINTRKEKLPAVELVGSAGSFFKNPVVSAAEYKNFKARVAEACGDGIESPHFETPAGIKLSAAWMIDKAGLKGIGMGGAATWQTQPLVIVNSSSKATPEEIVALEHHIISEVEKKFGITLSPEVEHIGNLDS